MGVSNSAAHSGTNCAVMSGGKGFLHSSVFDVTAGKTYTLRAWIKGDGKMDLGILWWAKYDDEHIAMASPHWQHMEKPVAAQGAWKQVTASYTAPADATRAYVRIVVTDGKVFIDDVTISG